MVGPQPVGCARYSPPPWNCQFQAPPASFSATPTGSSSGDSNNSDDLITPVEYAQALNSSQARNARFCLKSSEDSVSTDEDSSYSPSEGAAIQTGLPGPENEGINPTAIFKGDGTNEEGEIPTGLQESDNRPINVITAPQIVEDSNELTNPILGIWPRVTNIFDAIIQGVHKAFVGEGLQLSEA